jgi:hypothetical protein
MKRNQLVSTAQETRWLNYMMQENWELFEKKTLPLEGLIMLANCMQELGVEDKVQEVQDRIAHLSNHTDENAKILAKECEQDVLEAKAFDKAWDEDEELQEELAEEDEDIPDVVEL